MKSATTSDVRIDRLPALFVEKGEPPSAFLSAGAFESVWTGKLQLPKRQRLVFSFEGEGAASLVLDGKELLSETGKLGLTKSAETRLNQGEQVVEIRYRSRADGSGQFRLMWQERSFPRQSVPPSAFICDADDRVKQSLLRRQGREWFALMHCAKCHTSAAGIGADPMQEMQEIAPLLVNTGAQVNEAWLRGWLASPHQWRPATSMPSLFDPAKETHRQDIADVAAYVASLKSIEIPNAAESAKTDASKGAEHFHKLGCAACHTLPEVRTADMSGRRIPLHHVRKKFRPAALVAYLKAPDALAPHRGMPNMQLSDEECRTLSAFLLEKAEAPAPPEAAKGDQTRGAQVAMQHHCFACHAGMPMPERIAIPSLEEMFRADWTKRGCVSAEPRGSRPPNHRPPNLALSEPARAALLAFRSMADAALQSLRHNDKAEAAARKFHSLRCDACHARDGKQPSFDPSETRHYLQRPNQDQEKVDQSVPHLTFLGEMLQAPYVNDVIRGATTTKTRPWLDRRMPGYVNHAKTMAEGMARIHGIDPQEQPPAKIDDPLAKIGGALIDKETGFGCNTCHAVGQQPPTAAFEVQGINFDLSASRLRREWYDRWMDHPASVTPSTKMPQYAPAGRSLNPTFDGDGTKQFDAIWHYLQSVKKTAP